MQAEMHARVLQSQQQVSALQKRYDATTDASLREALQLHIEAAKREGQLEMFRIQLRHAQANGRTDDAKELQAILERAALEKRPALPALPTEAPRAVPLPRLTKAVRQ
jgi:ABC-type phosphate transport system auxiliary subunit